MERANPVSGHCLSYGFVLFALIAIDVEVSALHVSFELKKRKKLYGKKRSPVDLDPGIVLPGSRSAELARVGSIVM